MRTKTTTMLAIFGLTLAACGSDADPIGNGNGSGDGNGAADMGPPDMQEVPLQVAPTGARRLSVTQLERSLDVVGNLEPGTIQLPANLALTLGQPDYRSTTQRSFEPSPLFMKFMVDLGGIVCQSILAADAERPESERVLLLPDEPTARLRRIWFRFTGIEGEAATPYVDKLAQVESEASAASPNNPNAGLLAVCLAAVTSPEFLIY